MGAEEVEAVAASGTRICALATGVTPDRVTTDGPDADPRAIRAVLGKHVRIGRAGVSTTALSRITAA